MKKIELQYIEKINFDYLIIDFPALNAINIAFLWVVKNNEIIFKTQKGQTKDIFNFIIRNKFKYATSGSCSQIVDFYYKYGK